MTYEPESLSTPIVGEPIFMPERFTALYRFLDDLNCEDENDATATLILSGSVDPMQARPIVREWLRRRLAVQRGAA